MVKLQHINGIDHGFLNPTFMFAAQAAVAQVYRPVARILRGGGVTLIREWTTITGADTGFMKGGGGGGGGGGTIS